MKRTLKIFDRPLVEFELLRDDFGIASVSGMEYIGNDPDRARLPMALLRDFSGESLLSWLQSRTIPKNRAYVAQLFNQAGITMGDVAGVLDVCKGLSVQDAFWVDDGSGKSFSELNLFDNEFDEALALTAYTGYTSSEHRKAGLSSEWTTSGQFPKAWRRIAGEVMLYKGGPRALPTWDWSLTPRSWLMRWPPGSAWTMSPTA